MKHIVKRAGHEEHYEPEKVFYTSYAACLNAGLSDKVAQQVAKKVVQKINQWIKSRQEVSSKNIFQQVIKFLNKEHQQAAFMYETHRDIF